MPMPIVCLDAALCQFVAVFRPCLSKPQARYFVIVLLGSLLCEGRHTLSGLRRQVAEAVSVAGLSRFLSRAPWSATAVSATWISRFHQQLAPAVQAEQQRQRQARPHRRGRPKAPVVTGYLIGDDSTLPKRKGQQMEGVGTHYSTTERGRVRGHSLVQCLYVLLGRQCPLAPQLYRQQAVCTAAGVPFRSKVDLLEERIRTFVPVPGTQTHVLLDSWYTAKRIWRAARHRGFLITSGLKSNRSLRVPDAPLPCGWRWQTLRAYAAGLQAADYQAVLWPSQGEQRTVFVHVIATRVRKLYRCQVVIVRESLTAPLSEVRFWASSDLTADLSTLVGHIAARWAIEVLFGDAKELLGLDHYQVLSATALLRWWTLVLAAYIFLDEERARLQQVQQRHVTLGEARAAVQQAHHRHLLGWIYAQCQAGASVDDLAQRLCA